MCEKSIKIVILFVVLSVLSVTFQGCNKSKKISTIAVEDTKDTVLADYDTVSTKQAEQVKKEVKSITAILDDFAADNNIDPQFRQKIEDVRSIAQHPMENPKSDIESLIGTIKQLESCRDNPETIAINGKNVDFPFDDAISYVENLLKEYGIDRLTTAAGDAFDGKIMSALEFEHTSNPARNDTVFKMLFSG